MANGHFLAGGTLGTSTLLVCFFICKGKIVKIIISELEHTKFGTIPGEASIQLTLASEIARNLLCSPRLHGLQNEVRPPTIIPITE